MCGTLPVGERMPRQGRAPATRTSARVAPNSAPASSDRESVPGTANACMKIYAIQKPASTYPCVHQAETVSDLPAVHEQALGGALWDASSQQELKQQICSDSAKCADEEGLAGCVFE